MDLFAREYLLPRPVLREFHVNEGLTSAMIATHSPDGIVRVKYEAIVSRRLFMSFAAIPCPAPESSRNRIRYSVRSGMSANVAFL